MDFCLLVNMGKNIGKNKSKNLSNKKRQKFIDHAQQSPKDALKTASKITIQKAEATSDLIWNKIADKITRVSKTSPKSNSETNEKEIHRERHIYTNIYIIYIYPEQRQKSNDNLTLI